MRRKGYVVGLGHIGDFATFAQAAALGYIGHDDIDGLFFDDFAKAVAQVCILSGADRRLSGVCDIGHGLNIFRRHRLFQPHQVQIF